MYTICSVFNICTYSKRFLKKYDKKVFICKTMMIDAFVSIEYTLLIPVLFVLYGFLIGIGIYQYNQCILQTNMYILGIVATEFSTETPQNQIEKLQEIETQLYYDKYFGGFDIRTVYSLKGSQLEVTGFGNINNISNIFGVGQNKWEIRASCKVDMMNSVDTLRLWKTTYGYIRRN